MEENKVIDNNIDANELDTANTNQPEKDSASLGKKLLTIARNIIIVVCALVIIVVIGAKWYFQKPVADYNKASTKAFVIPGLNSGFVPQGIDYDARSEEFFVTGYFDEKPCQIYRVDMNGENVGKVTLHNADGSDFVCHAGGIAVHDDYVFVAGGFDNCLYVFEYADIMSAPYDSDVDCVGIFDLNRDSDYLTVACLSAEEDGIYIAEFYREENYPTADSHHITTGAGDENTALCLKFEYSDDEDSKFGVNSNPVAAFSLPGLVQGIDVHEGNVYLSTSYAVARSEIYKYDMKMAVTDKTITALECEVPLYELDSASLIASKEISPMAEEIIINDGKMYTMCESASNKYVFGKLTGGEYCYATDINFFN